MKVRLLKQILGDRITRIYVDKKEEIAYIEVRNSTATIDIKERLFSIPDLFLYRQSIYDVEAALNFCLGGEPYVLFKQTLEGEFFQEWKKITHQQIDDILDGEDEIADPVDVFVCEEPEFKLPEIASFATMLLGDRMPVECPAIALGVKKYKTERFVEGQMPKDQVTSSGVLLSDRSSRLTFAAAVEVYKTDLQWFTNAAESIKNNYANEIKLLEEQSLQ